MSEHTAEPWSVNPLDIEYEENSIFAPTTANGQRHLVANVPPGKDAQANARRIVACVNACKGIKTDALARIAALEKRLAEAEADAQHPESVCDDCGEKNVVWSAPSELWNAVCRPAGEVGPDPMLCPHCFIERYRAANEANTQSAIDAALESIVQEIPGGSIIDPQVVCDIIRSRIRSHPLAELQATIDEQRREIEGLPKVKKQRDELATALQIAMDIMVTEIDEFEFPSSFETIRAALAKHRHPQEAPELFPGTLDALRDLVKKEGA